MKIVINARFGGFSLSYEGVMLYAKLKGIKLYAFHNPDIKDWHKYERWDGEGEIPFCVHYNKLPKWSGKDHEKNCFSDRDIERDDPALIEVVEKLGDKASGKCAELKIVEIPDGTDWVIDEYDGNEHIDEVHKSWS